MSFAVVILSARSSNLIACIAALRACEPNLQAEQIIVVDDGARADAEAHVGAVTWVSGVKPFVFARNANLGIVAAGQRDVILLNDDAQLTTPHGFTRWSQFMAARPVGVSSAAISGHIGNPRQRVHAALTGLEPEPETLAFACAYLSRATLDQIGLLDERFVGYGYEDNDYCDRVKEAGLKLGVWHGCVVEHGQLSSTFRTRPDINKLFAENQMRYKRKRRSQTPRQIDLMFLAYNRLAFTQESFTALLANTDWDRVNQLIVYDDGSTDGTAEWLGQHIARVPVKHRLEATQMRAPVAALNQFVDAGTVPLIGKIDNDTMLPPGWLTDSLSVIDRSPEIEMLGIEAMHSHALEAEVRSATPARFTGGIGVFRRSAFAQSRPISHRTYYGFGDWQQKQKRKCAWIEPALSVFLLDRLPIEPWRTYSQSYIARGWQRPWSAYNLDCTLWHWRWPP